MKNVHLLVLNCNPDGHFLEYKFNREIARRIVLDLQDRGYDAELLVPEETDIPLKERARRVNSHCAALGKENVILVSIHANAAGNGSKWFNATGWSVYTSKGHTKSDNLATCLAEAAIKNLSGRKIRSDWSDGDIDFEESFYLLNRTLCAACLTENGFMTNLSDVSFLQSLSGMEAITMLHVEGICDYLAR
ncbi:MAG: N-acetylmuramoyl-L-alanine amidase [Bacteroidales bacterium]|nr:N-acetylmuramoyl-L-alanine amidase [Candidatus Cacconaster scatequi]